MNVDSLIKNLVAYATAHLHLDELDEIYARNRLIELFGLTDYNPDSEVDIDAIYELASPDLIVEPMLSYAIEKGLIPAEKADTLYSKIMDIVSLKPSEVTEMFEMIRKKSSPKAFDWLYDYGVKVGEIDPLFDKTERWEAKATQHKIEVMIDRYSEPDNSPKNAYPSCRFCKENEGFVGKNTLRTIPLDISDGKWFFRYSPRPCLIQQGYVISDEHAPIKPTAEILTDMATFVNSYNPMFYIATASGNHGHFVTGFKSTPLFKSPILKTIKSKQYPYMSVSIPDWYVNVVRVSHTNKEKTVECAEKLITAWLSSANDRSVYVICRKIEQEYSFEIFAMSSNAVPKAAHSNIKSGELDISDCLGLFTLPSRISGQLEKLEGILAGKTPNEPLTGDMKVHQKMLDKLLKEGGDNVSPLEARLNLHDEINAIAEKALNDSKVVSDEEFATFVQNTL